LLLRVTTRCTVPLHLQSFLGYSNWGRSCTQLPLPMKAKFGMLTWVHGWSALTNQILFWSGNFVALAGGENTQILQFFGVHRFVMSPIGGVRTKLNGISDPSNSNNCNDLECLCRLFPSSLFKCNSSCLRRAAQSPCICRACF